MLADPFKGLIVFLNLCSQRYLRRARLFYNNDTSVPHQTAHTLNVSISNARSWCILTRTSYITRIRISQFVVVKHHAHLDPLSRQECTLPCPRLLHFFPCHLILKSILSLSNFPVSLEAAESNLQYGIESLPGRDELEMNGCNAAQGIF